jgi:hypothetical protein
MERVACRWGASAFVCCYTWPEHVARADPAGRLLEHGPREDIDKSRGLRGVSLSGYQIRPDQGQLSRF